MFDCSCVYFSARAFQERTTTPKPVDVGTFQAISTRIPEWGIDERERKRNRLYQHVLNNC